MKKILHAVVKYTLLLFGIIIPALSYAQGGNGSIQGTVQSSGQIVPMASVQLRGTKRGVHTDEAGKFVLNNIQPGNYQLRVSEVGYDKLDTAITVNPGQTLVLNLSLSNSSSRLDEVTVTDTKNRGAIKNPSTSLRLNTPLIETPQNITVTTGVTIKNIGALSLSEVLRTSSGIIAGGARQDISFNIRGTQVYSSILRNGIGSGYWYNQEVDASMIEQVEFIKGPVGFMISNTEPGGLVNIVTKQPTHKRTTRVEFGAGSWNLMRTNIDLGGEISKSLTYRLNAGIQRNDEFYQFGKFKKDFVAAALSYEVDDKTTITAEYNRMNGLSVSNGQNVPTVNGQFFQLPDKLGVIDPNVPGTKSADNYYRLHVSHRFTDKWKLNAQAGAANGPWGGYMMYNDGISPTYDTIYRYMAYTGWKNKLKTIQAFLDGEFNTGANTLHKILVGVDYGNTDVHSYGGDTWGDRSRFSLALNAPSYYIPVDSLTDFSTDAFDTKYGSKYSALYVQDHIKFYDKLIVTLAARYTHAVSWANYSDPYEQTDKKLVPRFGLTYLIAKNLSAYGMYDGAFIAQNGRSFSGQVFKPLIGNNIEFGVKGQFFDRFNASIAAYQITKNNALTADPEHPSFQVQSGQLVSKGIEFDIMGNVLPNLAMFANYAYTDAKITKDEDPLLVGLRNSGAVKHTANIFGRYSFKEGFAKGFSIGGGLQYMGDISAGLDYERGIYAGTTPSYTLFDAAAGYTYKNVSLFLNAYNITNKRHITQGYRTTYPDWQYTPGAPANYRLSLSISL